MTSASSQAAILLFDIQALNEQNEAQRKQMDKCKREVKCEETAIEQSTHEDAKRKKARTSGQDVVSRRRRVVKAMMKRAQKTNSSSTNETQKAASAKATSQAQGTVKEHSVFSEKEVLALGKTFQDLMKMNLEVSAVKAPIAEFDIHNGDLLEEMFKRENLVKCQLNDAQLLKAKKNAKKLSRVFRQILSKTLPTSGKALAKALAKHGVDLGAQNEAQKSQSKDIDRSIYASIIDAIEINEMLQQLGVKTEVSQMDFEQEMSTELLDEVNKRFNANNDLINKAHHQDCMQKSLKIIGDVFGALFVFVGLPEIGVPIILAANGVIEKWISAMAKGLGISEYAVKGIIVAFAAVIAAASFGAGAPISACIMGLLFVAGLIGWVTDTVGVIATGQTDESKFPGWVTWAGMGINIGLALISGGEGLLNLARSIGNTLLEAGTWAVESAGEFATWVSESFSTVATETEGLAGELESSLVEGEVQAIAAESDAALLSSAESDAALVNSAESGGLASGSAPASGVASAEGQIESMTVSLQEIGASAIEPDAISISSFDSDSSTLSISSSEGGSISSGSTAESPAESAGGDVRSSAQTRVTPENNSTSSPASGADGEALNPISQSQATAPEESMQSVSENQAAGSDTRTIKQKMASYLRKAFTKLLAKLLEMKSALQSGIAEASEEAGMLSGAKTAAEKAEEVTQQIEKVLRVLQRLARWAQLGAAGAQGIVEFEMAQCQEEIGGILKETAELTGQTELLEQFVNNFNVMIKSTHDSEVEFGQSAAQELEVLGAIISTQRRNNNILMSA